MNRCRGISTLTTALVMIVSIIISLVTLSIIMLSMQYIMNFTNIKISTIKKLINTRITFIYGEYNKTNKNFYIVMENQGPTINSISEIKISFGGLGSYDIYVFSSMPCTQCKCWNVIEVDNPNGIWDHGETLIIYLYNCTALEPPYSIDIVHPMVGKFTFSFGEKPWNIQ